MTHHRLVTAPSSERSLQMTNTRQAAVSFGVATASVDVAPMVTKTGGAAPVNNSFYDFVLKVTS